MREQVCQLCPHHALPASSFQGRAGSIQGNLAPTTLPSPWRPLASLCQPGRASWSHSVPRCEVSGFATNALPQELRGIAWSSLGTWVPREGQEAVGGCFRPGTGQQLRLKVQKPPRRATPASRERGGEGGAWSCAWCPERPRTLLTSQAAPPTPTFHPPPAAAPSPGTVWTWTLCAPARALVSLSHGHGVGGVYPAPSLPSAGAPATASPAAPRSTWPHSGCRAGCPGVQSEGWTVSGVGHLLAARSWSPTLQVRSLATREPGQRCTMARPLRQGRSQVTV